jgi:hypothetical protein
MVKKALRGSQKELMEYKANKAHVEYMILAIAPDDIPPRNAQSTQVGG